MEINRYNLYLRFGYYFLDIVILYLTYHFAYLWRWDSVPVLSDESGFIGLVSLVSWPIIVFILSLNNPKSINLNTSYLGWFMLGQMALALIIVNALVFTQLDISRLFLIVFFTAQGILLGVNRLLWLALFRTIRAAGYNLSNIFLYGTNDEYKTLKTWAKQNKDYGYHLNGWFKDPGTNNKIFIDLPDEFNQIVGESNVDHFVLDPTHLDPDHLASAIDWAEDKGARIHLIEPQTETLTRKLQVRDTFGPFAAVKLRREPLNITFNQRIKRTFDILFACATIVLFYWWFYLIVGLLIKLSNKGPVLIKQNRVGKDGNIFKCLKFRTMTSDKNSELGYGDHTEKDDPRITYIGRFLRRTNLDETPQFMNVLLGNMSIIGPRPMPIGEDENKQKLVNKYKIRRFVKPGITGLAAVNGYRGGTSNIKEMQERINYDINYIENWTFWLDIKICFMTTYQMLTLTTGAH